jgi:hypothetical protein
MLLKNAILVFVYGDVTVFPESYETDYIYNLAVSSSNLQGIITTIVVSIEFDNGSKIDNLTLENDIKKSLDDNLINYGYKDNQ